MTTERLPFIDWMKCTGMALIVMGHVGGAWINHLTPPFYPKQLGVAFFLFVTAFSLARDRRPWAEVLFRRVFEVYLFGVAFALLMSAIIFAYKGDLNESNYLPFLFGANVLCDYFPANPTTWFIGTYTHVLLLGTFVLRHVRIRPWMFVPVILAEILARGFLMDQVGLYTAYMLLTNWATVVLLGIASGQHAPVERRRAYDWTPALGALILLVLLWPAIARSELDPLGSFPFMRFAMKPALVALGLTSTSVTLLYALYTWSTYRLTRHFPDWAPIRFFARNTLLIFIAHMPVYYGINPLLRTWVSGHPTRVAILFLVCYVGLAIASEIVLRVVRPTRLRDQIWSAWKGARALQTPVITGNSAVPQKTAALV
jgi:hypothetical protein